MKHQKLSWRILSINLSKSVLYVLGLLLIISFWTWAKNVFPFYELSQTQRVYVDDKNQVIALFALNGYLGLIGILLTIFIMVYLTKELNKLNI